MDPRPNQHQLLYCNCFCTVTNFYEFVKSLLPEKASLFWDGDPYRIRTDVNGVRGRCLNHLTNGPCLRRGFPLDGAPIQWDGTPSGTRTLDTLIKSQVLYQLS